MGSGTALAVAGTEVLIQECGDEQCQRRWADLVSGRTVRTAPPDDRRWLEVGEPIIPGHAAPIDTVGPDDSQLLVATRPIDALESDPDIGLLRVDVATFTTGAVPLSDGFGPGDLATWSRDGRFVVVIQGNDVVTVDLETGIAERNPDLIPDVYFILAAG